MTTPSVDHPGRPHPGTDAPSPSRLGMGLVLTLSLAGLLGLTARLAAADDPGVAKDARAPLASPLELAAALDRVIDQKLEAEDVRPAPRSADSEFLRRIYLDLVGTVPTVDEVKAFLADTQADKRNQKIEELLASDAYAENWSVVWFKATTGLSPAARAGRAGKGARYIRGKPGEMYLDWLQDQMAANRPYDAWVYDLLTATGRTDEVGSTGFVARWSENTNNLASATAKTFLGTRIQCCQCHDHRYEPDWKQADFRGMAAFFGNLRTARAPEYREFQQLRRQMQADRQKQQAEKKSLDGEGGDGMGMDGGMDAPDGKPNATGGKDRAGKRAGGAYADLEKLSPAERRKALQKLRGSANVLVISDVAANSRAAEVAKRRLAQRMKKGGNANLDRLKERLELAATTPKFWMASEVSDVIGIPRRMLLARWVTSGDNELFARTLVNRYWGHFLGAGIVDPVDDFNSFNEPSHPEILDLLAADFVQSGFDLKRLVRMIVNTKAYQRTSRWTAEEPEPQRFAHAPVRQLTTEQLYHALVRAAGMEARLDRAARQNARRVQQGIFSVFSFVFDDDEGAEQQDFEGSIPQGLFLMNGQLMQGVVSARRGSLLSTLMRTQKDEGGRITYLYLAAFGREPTAKESAAVVRFLAAQGSGTPAYEDLLWALLNSAEFMTNH